MSSDFERRLREARATLPEPDAAVTQRARERAWAAVRRRRPRVRVAALVGAALVLAIGLGVGIGALVTPSGTAARGPVGLGFLAEPGWFVLQSGARASTSSPAVAMASNVPFAADDDVGGLPESSALPYSTLLGLPTRGIVIAAVFTPRSAEPWRDAFYPERMLPLRLPTVIPRAEFGAQLRPEEPLGVYELHATVNDHNVEIRIYFGTPQPSRAVISRAQSQLDQLIVRSDRSAAQAPRRPAFASAPSTAAAVGDRTYVCATAPLGGIYEIEAQARTGTRQMGDRSTWFQLPLAGITSGGSRSSAAALDNMLVWVTAGAPSATTTVIPNPFAGFTYPVRVWGTLAVNAQRCKPASSRIPLASTGLRGGPASQLGDALDCASPRRVVVRVRWSAASSTLKSHRQFLRTTEPLGEASLAVRTQAGKPLVYATVSRSGKTRLFTAKSCVED